MPNEKPKTQQLRASNISVRIGEAIQARTKDPLWFLARQWQSGEFAAENGGKPAYLSVAWRDYPLETITIGEASDPIDLDQPLEYAVEREDTNDESAAWRTEALEYEFRVETTGHRLAAEEYDGHRLDWYHFDYLGPQPAQAPPPIETRRVTPTQLYVRGAPHPRWWRLEEGNAYFDAPDDPEPNVLSLLLPEFFYVDANNWFIAPVPGRSGVMREIASVTVVDSFGVTTVIGPVGANDAAGAWRVFALAPAEDSPAPQLDARHLFTPNIALEVLHNDDTEDVRFLRDEEANLVWAFEHRYRAADGTEVVNGDGVAPAVGSSGGGGAAVGDSLPRFVLRSDVASHWIPYVPRHLSTPSVTNGEIYLRRARTVEAATPANPQYNSRIVSESWRINEEQVPRTGIRVRRIARFARGSDGVGYHWVGRYRETGRRTAHPDLRFDFITEEV